MVRAIEAAIIGAGPAGLVAALALARSGIDVAIVAPPFDAAQLAAIDGRTTALIGPSVTLLRNLGVWPLCAPHSAAFTMVRIADARQAIVRAPETAFEARELGLESFGANIPNPALLIALNEAVDQSPQIARIATKAVTGIDCSTGSTVKLQLAEGGHVLARLAVGADGRNSIAAAGAGINVRSWQYPQAAVVTNFDHTRAHNGTVYELHHHTGPLTTVPLPGLCSSLVWVEEPDEAQRIASLEDSAFCQLLEERLGGILGSIRRASARRAFPLSGASAERMAANRVALVGESAHVIPPIGAQGLNLGLRDAATLADCMADAKASGRDIGGDDVLEAYHRARAGDVGTRSTAIDLLNRSLLADFVPFDMLRGAAVHALASSSTLRRFFMTRGLGASGDLPLLMQPEATSP